MNHLPERMNPVADAKPLKVSAVPTTGSTSSIWMAIKETLKYSSTAIVGVSVSLVAHTIILVFLAFFLFSETIDGQGVSILGSFRESDSDPLLDVQLNSTLAVQDAGESAPLEFPDLVQTPSDQMVQFDAGEMLRGVLNGTGEGEGLSDEGTGQLMNVPPVNVPSYAVTKGSFSAWTEPRDPAPYQRYMIVIQVRLPERITKYRASDLSGMVIGTDRYKQAIRFRYKEEFPIEDGGVQVRIPVPGAHQLVRDTIRIESRLLKEKQTIQIVF